MCENVFKCNIENADSYRMGCLARLDEVNQWEEKLPQLIYPVYLGYTIQKGLCSYFRSAEVVHLSFSAPDSRFSMLVF